METKSSAAAEEEQIMREAAQRTALQLASVMGQKAKRPATALEARRLKGHKLRDGTKLEADERLIKSTVPKPYKITLDDHSPVMIYAGVHDLPEHIFEHWFSKANGVKAFDPSDLPPEAAKIDVEALREQVRAEERERIRDEERAKLKKEMEDAAAAKGNGKSKGESK